MHAPGSWLGAELRREDGDVFTVVELPFHDREKAIPRGHASTPFGHSRVDKPIVALNGPAGRAGAPHGPRTLAPV